MPSQPSEFASEDTDGSLPPNTTRENLKSDLRLSPVYECQIVLVGESGVGKTSLQRRFTDATFNDNTSGAPGDEFRTTSLNIRDINVNLKVWDSIGQVE